MKSFLLTCLAVLITVGLFAQGPQDALRYSFVFPQGSARFAGTGGAISALGVDYTTIHTNPAGIGANRFSNFHVSPGLNLTSVDARLTNGGGNPTLSESANAFTLPSIGLVFAADDRSRTGINFGVGLTRLADFNETIRTQGVSQGSIFDAIVDDLNEEGFFDPFRAELLFDIDFALQDDEDGFFTAFNFDENQGIPVTRTGLAERSGSMHEFALALSGGRNGAIQWGVTLGVPFFNYDEVTIYDEVDEGDQLIEFDDGGFDTNLEASGSGVNFKLGLMARPTDGLRLSAAVHSPTFWNIEETFFTTLEYNFTDADNVAFGGTARSDQSESVINLRTPWRFLVGAGYVVGNNGFVGVDIDYQNYAANEFSFDDFATADEPTNADIDQLLTSSVGVRFGGEFNVKPFQVRAGVEYRQLPFGEARFLPAENPDNLIDSENILTYSGGVGFAKGKFFTDLALQYAGYNTLFRPYDVFLISAQNVETERTRLSAILTVGYRGF